MVYLKTYIFCKHQLSIYLNVCKCTGPMDPMGSLLLSKLQFLFQEASTPNCSETTQQQKDLSYQSVWQNKSEREREDKYQIQWKDLSALDHMLHVWNIWLKSMVNVGKYSSPMEQVW